MDIELTDLVSEIIRAWKKENCLSSDVCHYLESGCGIRSLSGLSTELDDKDSADRDVILELILFPDPYLRRTLEPLLPVSGLDNSRIVNLVDSLVQARPFIMIRFPGDKNSLNVPITDDQIRLFVERLYLDRPLDEGILTAVGSSFTEHLAVECRVCLRCCRHEFSPGKKRFLIHFITQCEKQVPDYKERFGLFEAGLKLAADAPESDTVESFIIYEYQRLKKMLVEILRFEEKKDRFSMEYMMMSGYTAPPDSYENTRNTLFMLDRIINQVLELPGLPEPVPPQIRDHGRFDPKTDMGRILDLLSDPDIV